MNVHARRALTVLLLASLLVGDGRTSVRAEAAAGSPRNAVPVTLRWVTRLATALQRAEARLRLCVRRMRRVPQTATPRRPDPLVRALLTLLQFRLPPPIAA